MMNQFLTLTLVAALSLAPTFAQTKKTKAAAPAPAPTFGNVSDITAAQMKAYLGFIASDEMEGRDTPSKGLDITAKFLAAMMERWGVQPAGENGTYFQKIQLRRGKIDPEKTTVEINGQTYKYGDDFLANPVSANVTANCVYVGHGFIVKSKNINAYQTPSGTIDVKDKIMLVSMDFPKGVTFRDLNGKQGEDWVSPTLYAQQNGAKGVIMIPNFMSLAGWKMNQQRALQRGSLRPEMGVERPAATIPVITASLPMLNMLMAGEKVSPILAFNRATAGEMAEPFDLNKKVTLKLGSGEEMIPTQNVIGVLPGSDPVLKNEYIAIGAHYDHVGIGNPINGDAIFNGADDDGSGTTAVLALAEALAKGQRPKRSILFIWHCGEEKGLWGSEYFVNHPTVDIKQIITQLNIDMIGRSKKEGDTNPRNRELSGPNEIYVIGSKMMSTELGALSERVNNSFLKMSFNYKYDDPNDPNRFFFRSDHFNYAQKGIPIIFYFDGEHEDYHRPSDTVDKIDFQKMEKITRTIYATAWELGNAASRPKVDKKLPAELSGN